MRRRPSLIERARQNILVLEAIELTVLFILLGLFTVWLGMSDGAPSDELLINIIVVLFVMGGAVVSVLVAWGMYLLVIRIMRRLPLWIFVPLVIVSGGLALGVVVVISLFDLNRLMLARLLYNGEAPVEYFWSKESSQALEAWKRGERAPKPGQLARVPDPAIPAERVLRLRVQPPGDAAALSLRMAGWQEEEERGSWFGRKHDKTRPEATVETFYGEMLYAGPDNCRIAFLQLLPDGAGRGGVSTAEELPEAWEAIWRQARACLVEQLAGQGAARPTSFTQRLGEVQIEPLTDTVVRVTTEVIIEGTREGELNAAAVVQFENALVRQQGTWLLAWGLPGSL